MTYFNKTLASLQPSKSVTLMAKTKSLQKTDPDIINLTGGEPDFDTPNLYVTKLPDSFRQATLIIQTGLEIRICAALWQGNSVMKTTLPMPLKISLLHRVPSTQSIWLYTPY